MRSASLRVAAQTSVPNSFATSLRGSSSGPGRARSSSKSPSRTQGRSLSASKKRSRAPPSAPPPAAIPIHPAGAHPGDEGPGGAKHRREWGAGPGVPEAKTRQHFERQLPKHARSIWPSHRRLESAERLYTAAHFGASEGRDLMARSVSAGAFDSRPSSLPDSPMRSASLFDPEERVLEPVLEPESIQSPVPEPEDNSIKVCIRLRPLRAVEVQRQEKKVLVCSATCTNVLHVDPPMRADRMSMSNGQHNARSELLVPTPFQFTWVMSETASQADVYSHLGERVVKGMVDGFNGCVFAYGQTGSGKSYTIFGGSGEERGLLPRIAQGLFDVLQRGSPMQSQYLVRLSYLELYNEKVRDLLRPNEDGTALEICQHPRVGVFVDGLTSNVVQSSEDVQRLLQFGNAIRVVSCTNMNMVSSRSHAVVTLQVERTICKDNGQRVKRRAQLHCVDLVGSEWHSAIQGHSEARLSESRNINKSLSALSMLVSRLAQKAASGSSSSHIPYRNSKLTFLLSESLMGNCRSAMVACMSPAESAWSMTENTLRFASLVKTMCTQPMQNDEVEGDLVRTLRAEIETFRHMLKDGNQGDEDIHQKLKTTQSLSDSVGASKEEWKVRSRAMDDQRQQALESLGLSSSARPSTGKVGEMASDALPYLVNVCDDPLLSGCLTYVLHPLTPVHVGSDEACAVQIDGLRVQPQMCTLMALDEKTVEVHVASPESRYSLASTKREAAQRTPDAGKQASVASRTSAPKRVSIEASEDTASEAETELPHRAGTPPSRKSGLFWRRSSLFKSGVVEVFVNSERAFRLKMLQHGDRLRVGRTHVFQLFIPQAHEHKRFPVNETAPGLLVENIGQQLLMKDYMTRLQERIGIERASKVLQASQEMQPLIEEASDITEELRGSEDPIIFKAHVLTDVLSMDEDPELTVALRRVGQFEEQLWKHPDPNRVSGPLVAIWSLPKFRQRLEVMRDLYQEVSERDKPWGEADDVDPWKDDRGLPLVSSDAIKVSSRLASGESPRPEEPDAEPNDAEMKTAARMSLLEQQLAQAKVEVQVRDEELAVMCVELPIVKKELEDLMFESEIGARAVEHLHMLQVRLGGAEERIASLQAQLGVTANPATTPVSDRKTDRTSDRTASPPKQEADRTTPRLGPQQTLPSPAPQVRTPGVSPSITARRSISPPARTRQMQPPAILKFSPSAPGATARSLSPPGATARSLSPPAPVHGLAPHRPSAAVTPPAPQARAVLALPSAVPTAAFQPPPLVPTVSGLLPPGPLLLSPALRHRRSVSARPLRRVACDSQAQAQATVAAVAGLQQAASRLEAEVGAQQLRWTMGERQLQVPPAVGPSALAMGVRENSCSPGPARVNVSQPSHVPAQARARSVERKLATHESGDVRVWQAEIAREMTRLRHDIASLAKLCSDSQVPE